MRLIHACQSLGLASLRGAAAAMASRSSLPSQVAAIAALPLEASASTSATSKVLMPSDLMRWLNAWWAALQSEHTKEGNLTHTSRKPSGAVAGQFGHVLFAGSRRNDSSSLSRSRIPGRIVRAASVLAEGTTRCHAGGEVGQGASARAPPAAAMYMPGACTLVSRHAAAATSSSILEPWLAAPTASRACSHLLL
jgi:hypothetical protein